MNFVADESVDQQIVTNLRLPPPGSEEMGTLVQIELRCPIKRFDTHFPLDSRALSTESELQDHLAIAE